MFCTIVKKLQIFKVLFNLPLASINIDHIYLILKPEKDSVPSKTIIKAHLS